MHEPSTAIQWCNSYTQQSMERVCLRRRYSAAERVCRVAMSRSGAYQQHKHATRTHLCNSHVVVECVSDCGCERAVMTR